MTKLPIDLSDILSIEWLQGAGLQLQVEDSKKTPFRSMHIADIMQKQVPGSNADKSKVICAHLHGIFLRPVQRWFKDRFEFQRMYGSAYKSYHSGLPGTSHARFKITVLTKDKEPKAVAEITASMDEIMSFTVYRHKLFSKHSKPEQEQKTIIPFPALLAIPAGPGEEVQVTEELVLSICQTFADGTMTINEACAKFGVTYLRLVEMLAKSEYCMTMYEEANRIHKALQNSRQLGLLDNRIIEILERGTYVENVIHYKKVMIPGQLEPKWIEDKKTNRTRDLSIGEIITLKAILMRGSSLSGRNAGDEFTHMSDKELLEYAARNGDVTDLLK